MGRHFEVRAAAMAATAKAKSAIYMRASKEIYAAAKSGVPDPESNLALRSAIEKYRKTCPKDVIERTIQEIRVEENKGHVKVFFKANGFMTYQVRIMMGAALRVALGRMSLEEVKIALDSEKRKILSYKADPIGLMLEEVLYAE